MCLPDFIEFKQIEESQAIIGYRNWNNKIRSIELKAQNREYFWVPKIDGPHLIKNSDSGLYAYNNYNNYYNYYNYNNYNNYNHNNYNHNLTGIILQFGKVAIHETGQRSEYAKIKTLFTISPTNAEGPQEFLDWIVVFNNHIKSIADIWEADTIHWQDCKEINK